MDTVTAAMLAFLSLSVAAYAHLKIPAFTDTQAKILVTRIILIVVGLAFGFVSSFYMLEMPQKILGFITAFGLVHVPAAIILLVKTKRGEKRS